MENARETELLEQITRRDALLAAARIENDFLRSKLDALSRRFFGKKSEQLNPAQLQLLFQELLAPGPALGKPSGPQTSGADSARPVKPKANPARERRPRTPAHLPVIEEVIVPPAVEAAPALWRRIGEEVTERLDFEPARFLCRRTVRPKYVLRGDADAVPVIAALPPCVLERGIATPGLLAQVLAAKYCDHLPLYRQAFIYRSRHGVELSRQTLAEWVGVGADWLRLIYEEIRSGVLAGGYVQVDETPVRYLAPGSGRTRQGYFWTCHRPGTGTVFTWQTSRAAACLDNIIPVNFTGIIQCDGYAAYDAFARGRPGQIALAGCWAHVRRKFFEACAQGCKRSALVLHLIQSLYRTEEELRKAGTSAKLRALVRSRQSAPVIARLRHALEHWNSRGRILPRSLLGQAIQYALGQC